MMLRGQQIDRRHFGCQSDIRLAADSIEQRRLDRAAGRVAGVNDSRNRVRPFLRQVKLALFACGERDVDFLEEDLAHHARALDGEKAHCLLARESGARADDVFDQLRRRIILAFVDDSALCPECVAVLRVSGLRHQQHFDSGAGEAERRC